MKIKEIQHEPLRYWASSSIRNMTYVVDLSENEGSGSCSCPDYITRRNPAIQQGEELFTRKTSCKHLLAVRKHFLKTTLREMARIINKGGR